MGKQDIVSNDFMRKPQRIADLLNAVVYNGRKVLRAENIRGITPIVPRIWWEDGKPEAEVRVLDVGCEVSGTGWTAKVYIQNQTDVCYAMPIRGADTDAAVYFNQWKDIGLQHKKDKDLRPGGEFMWNFAQNDRLDGVVTIVIYYGRKKWDGARRLKELLPAALGKDPLQAFIADYPLNLVEVRDFPNPSVFRSDLREVFTFMQKDSDKEELRQYVLDNQAVFDNIAEDACDLLAVMSDVKILKERKERYKNKGKETCQMCKALMDWAEEERAEGRKEGHAEGRAEGAKEGQEQISLLGLRMKAENRIDDFFRCLSDLDYRKTLLREYGMLAK